MTVVGWIVAIALALAGSMKLARSKEQLRPQMAWVEHFSPAQIKAIAGLEVVLALALIVGLVTGNTTLAGLAALALCLVMIGAVITHVRVKDPIGQAIPAAVLAVLAGLVAWSRLS